MPFTCARSAAQILVGAAACFALAAAHVIAAAPRQGAPAPAGRTVWQGVFTPDQTERGRLAYAEHCASCHGANLEGGEYRALTGDRFWTSWQDATVDRLLTHVSANMPHSEDGALKGTLSPGVYADIVAHILASNGFPAGAAPLTAASAAGIRILRKDGPSELPSGSFAHVVGCLARGADNKTWTLLKGSSPMRAIEGEAVNTKTPLGDRQYTLRFVLTPLDKYVGHRMSVQATLMGAGGVDGLNVASIQSVGPACD